MDKIRKQLFADLSDKGEGTGKAWSQTLLQLVHRHNARDTQFKLEEFVESVCEKDQAKLWEGIASRMTPLIEAVVLADDDDDEEEEGGGGRARESSAGGQQADAVMSFRVLQAVVALAQATLNASKKSSKLPEGVLQCAMALHDVLFQLTGVDGEALQANIAKVCEQWWKEERAGAEFLMPQLLPYLVARSLEDDAREAMVKRVYALRGALLLLDYEGETSGAFKTLLLQCFLKTTYLRCADGRRLLTYLFGLHPDLILDIHATVKNQLPRAGKKVVSAYGDVYFRAWKAAQGPYLQRIEQDCVQDLMQRAVGCSCPGLYANLRLMLQSFHSNKRLREVDAMLLRLYNPIIWRSLQVANPVVRAQATGLLVDAFPLQNPDAGTIEVNALLQKQLDMLQTLLLDIDPRVRVAAVAGVCRVLAAYWEAIPLNVTQAYITRLVGSLAFDGSSALVRQSVVEGLTLLLDNPLAHPVLRAALPLAAPLLHDKAERVRAAFLHLLNKVKGVRDIKFYHIVPVDQLLTRFSEDARSGSVSNKMSTLLLNSYFPQGPDVTGAKQVSRCLTFLRQNKGAALAFYSRLRHHVSLATVVKLAAMLMRCVFTAALKDKAEAKQRGKADRKRPRDKKSKAAGKNKGGGQEEDDSSSEDEEEKEEEEEGAVEPGTLEGILEVVRALWWSVSSELQESAHKAVATALLDTIHGQDVVGLYERLDDVRPLLSLACLSPGPYLPLLTPMIDDLRGEGSDAQGGGRVGPIMTTLCSWGRTQEVVDLISSSLEVTGTSAAASKTSSTARAPASSRGRAAAAPQDSKRKRGAASLESLTGGLVPPETALAMLDHLLRGEDDDTASTRLQVVGDAAMLQRLRAALHKARDAIDKRIKGAAKAIEPQGSAVRSVLVGCCDALLRLEVHAWAAALEASGGELHRLSDELSQDCLAWMDKTLLPAMLLQDEASSSNNDQQGGGAHHLMSPLSPPARKPRVAAASSAASRMRPAAAALAQEAAAACLTVLSDLVVCGVGVPTISQACQSWSERLLLPALRQAHNLQTPEEVEEARLARDMALACMPQLSKLAYQLAVAQQQAKAPLLPAALLEAVIQSAHHQQAADEAAQQRYPTSGVSASSCLSALLQLYGRGPGLSSRGGASSAALAGLTDRLLASIVTTHDEEKEGEQLSSALCSILAKSAAGINSVVQPLLSDLNDHAKTAASSNSSHQQHDNMNQVLERVRVVARLLEAAPEGKTRSTTATKLLKGLREAEEAGPEEEEERSQTLQAVSARLQQLTTTGGRMEEDDQPN